MTPIIRIGRQIVDSGGAMPSLDWMLIEREQPLRHMVDAAKAASESKGSILLLFGEAGIGKTSLLEVFREEISSACKVYWGGCDALYTPRPFGPLHDMGGDLGPAVENLLSGSASAPCA